MTKTRQAMLGAGVGGFLVWLGVRGSRWLKGELAYYRWRRQRIHTITLRSRENGDGLKPHVPTGAALALALCGMILTAGCVVTSPPSVGGGVLVGCVESPDAERDRYTPVIGRVAGRYGVHPDLIDSLIRIESAFNPRAVSRKGARGLMQLMPKTASLLGIRDVFDPLQNIEGGVRHLRGLLQRYRGNLPLALAAYNAGERPVDQYRGVPPFAETQLYVKEVLWLYQDRTSGRQPRYRGAAPAGIPRLGPLAPRFSCSPRFS